MNHNSNGGIMSLILTGVIFVSTFMLAIFLTWHYWIEARYSGKDVMELYGLTVTTDPMELMCLTWFAICHDDSQEGDHARMYLVLTKLVTNPRTPLEALLVLKVLLILRGSQCPQVQLLLGRRLRD